MKRTPEDGAKPAVDVATLAALLSQCPEVTRYSSSDEDEAWTLAHSLSDLAESFSAVSDDLLPKLMRKDINAAERYDLLLEIGEELRHILHHIKDPRFYSYLDDAGG